MATYQATKYSDTVNRAKSVPQGLIIQRATYTFGAGAAPLVGDVVQLMNLPVGAKVKSVLLYNAALGAGSQLSVGTNGAGNSAYYFSAQATNAAQRLREQVANPCLVVDALNTILQATVVNAAATGAIEVECTYSMDD